MNKTGLGKSACYTPRQAVSRHIGAPTLSIALGILLGALQLAVGATAADKQPISAGPIASDAPALPAPICATKPRALVCQLPLAEVQRREKAIIERDWRKVQAVLPDLARAKAASMPWQYVPESIYKPYCEALRQDLLSGKYKVLGKPDVASEEAGTVELSRAMEQAQNDCDKKSFDQESILRGPFWPDGAIWYYKLHDGFAHLTFSLSRMRDMSYEPEFFFDYRFEACKKGHRLPSFPRVGFGQGEDRTETVAIAVLKRGEQELLGLEYGVIHGIGDEQSYRYGPYGESLLPKSDWTPAQPSSGPRAIERQGPVPMRFIAAFIAPPPWRPHAAEPREYDDRGESEEPCIWKLPQ